MPKSSSLPSKVDFAIKQGDTFRRVFEFFETDGTTASDQTGATFKFIIEGEDDLILGAGLTLQGTDSNQILLSVDIDWAGTKKYEFERVKSGITWTPFEGKLISDTELDENE
jgi:hypothetical protein